MADQWHIRDVIDLEYFLHPDAADAPGRDREIFLTYTRGRPGVPDRRRILKYWLETRRQQERARAPEAVLPGEIYRETMSAAAAVLCALFLAAGAGLAWSLLSYSGKTPINVFTCLWVLIAPQIVLLMVLLASAGVFRAMRGGGMRSRYPLIATLFRRISGRMLNYAAANLPGERLSRIQAALGRVGQARTVYGGIFFWPLFNTAQAAGICFNIGILAALLLRITITDVAFGWQSTLQPDPQTVYRIVTVMAAPWAWLISEPAAHPTAAQIAGSKIVLKEGMGRLATQALVSWWPFLCLCVVFYGFLPRAVLLAGGFWRERRALFALEFTHSACDRLWQRMTTPRVQTDSRPYSRAGAEASSAAFSAAGALAEISAQQGLMPAIVALPEELEMDANTIDHRLRVRLGVSAAAVVPVDGNPKTDTEKLAQAARHADAGASPRLVIIQESWQPPIKENLNWIRRAKQAAGAQAGMIIGLVGKPADGGVFAAPVPETERVIWEQAIHAMGDAYTRVEVLGENHRDEA